MQLWRRLSNYAFGCVLIALSAMALTACSGSDDGGGGSGGGGGDGNFQAEANRKLSITPSQLNFDETEVGGENTKTLTIENTGNGKVKIKNISIEETGDDGRREFLTGDNWVSSTTLKPDSSLSDAQEKAIEKGEIEDPTELNLEITYRPLNEIEDGGDIVIKSNVTSEGRGTIRVPLSPSSLEPRINTPPSVNFTSVQPGTRRWKKLTVKNIGQVALKISKIQLSGSSTYKVTVPPKNDDSGDSGGDKEMGGNEMDTTPTPMSDRKVDSILPKTLQPGKSFDLRVWFSPEDNNAEEAKITIFSNDPNNAQKTVELIGNSGAPCLGLSHEDEISFGTSSTNQIATKTVTVENCRPRSEEPLKIKDIKVSEDAGNVFSVKKQSLPGDLANNNTFTLQGDNSANFVVTFTPPKTQAYEGELTIESNDPSRRTHTIKLVGSGSDNQCPNAIAKAKVKDGGRFKQDTINTLPLETIVFDGSDSKDPDGSVKRYEWSIIDRPADSTARLTPNSNVKKPELFLDLAGTYKVELVVYDNKDAASCGEQAIITVKVVPEDDIHVQLVWDTPSDTDQTDTNGADLDLHYLNASKATSWNEAPWDIFWHNKTADWGQENVKSDNPNLDIDDTDGAGPENVSHDNPAAGNSYKIGVYYYDDHGFGPSYATVRIYIDGKLRKEYKNKFLSGTFEFWKVGLIEWPSKNIYKRDEKFTGFPNTAGP